MKIRCAFLIGLFTAISMVLSPAPAVYATLTMDTPYIFTSNQSYSWGAFPTGYSFIIGANVSPAGPGITGTAQQISGGSHNVNLNYWPQPIATGEYDYRAPYDSSFNGQWQITVTDGIDVTTRVTSTLDDPRQLPLAAAYSLSTSTGALTPTLAWTGFDTGQFPGFSGIPVDGSDDFNLRVRVRNMAGKTLWQSSIMSTSVTSLTLPGEGRPGWRTGLHRPGKSRYRRGTHPRERAATRRCSSVP